LHITIDGSIDSPFIRTRLLTVDGRAMGVLDGILSGRIDSLAGSSKYDRSERRHTLKEARKEGPPMAWTNDDETAPSRWRPAFLCIDGAGIWSVSLGQGSSWRERATFHVFTARANRMLCLWSSKKIQPLSKMQTLIIMHDEIAKLLYDDDNGKIQN
jgi:hypothetical protein